MAIGAALACVLCTMGWLAIGYVQRMDEADPGDAPSPGPWLRGHALVALAAAGAFGWSAWLLWQG